MSARERTERGRPEGSPAVEALAAAARARLSEGRLLHVEAVVTTAREIAANGGWPFEIRRAVERAAWAHDAVKQETPESWIRRIEAAGEEPDPWAVEWDPELLHAQAAAAWAAALGETDSAVLAAVRHHPTAHPTWGDVGRMLYVADFCEPGRDFAEEAGTADLRMTAASGRHGLARAAREILRLRLRWLLDEGRAIHPDSWRTWDSWTAGPGP